MDFDDIVIGSGLAALGAAMGLCRHQGRRVGILCGPAHGCFDYYDQHKTVPCAFHGAGGLGNFWHGVIPTGRVRRLSSASDEAFANLFRHFYPRADMAVHMGQPGQFVPWRPIRPMRELQRMARVDGGRDLHLLIDSAVSLAFGSAHAEVVAALGRYRAHRVWLAAGALHTPDLLTRSFSADMARGRVSDHVFCYVGQLAHHPAPEVQTGLDGVFLQGWPASPGASEGLYSLRPALFDFRRLDHGIERRAVFGLPTGHLIRKLARRSSPGLLAEAFYNRFGRPTGAHLHSVYAQLQVRDAYDLAAGAARLQARTADIRRATDAARHSQPFVGLIPSKRPELALPGIHLHHSLDLDAMARLGIDEPGSPVQVVDASALSDIGPEHHSFEMLVAAHQRGRFAPT